MDVDTIYKKAKSFAELLNADSDIDVALGGLVVTKEISDPHNADLRKDQTDRQGVRVNLRDTSGIYLIVRPDQYVAYIGKAYKTKLHEELWNKLKTPVGDTIPRTYPNTYWSKMPLESDIATELREGKVCVAAFSIEPNYVCSLLEVYLQTVYYSVNSELPRLNSQIG